MGVPAITRLGVRGFILPVVFKLAPNLDLVKDDSLPVAYFNPPHSLRESFNRHQIKAGTAQCPHCYSLLKENYFCCTFVVLCKEKYTTSCSFKIMVIKWGQTTVYVLQFLFLNGKTHNCLLVGDSYIIYLKQLMYFSETQCGQCKCEMQNHSFVSNEQALYEVCSLNLQDKPANVSVELYNSSA